VKVQGEIRVVSIVEAWFVTGQAKNLLEFARRSRQPVDGIPPVNLSLITYERGTGASKSNNFVTAAREAGVQLDLVTEKGRFDGSAVGQIRAIVEKCQPDIIQTHNVKSHFLMRLSGLRKDHRWLGFHHGHTATDFKMRCYNQLDRWSLRAPDRVITVCGAFARDLERRGVAKDRITVRHNSVKGFQPADGAVAEALRRQFPPDVPLLICIGRLSLEKGQADLLNALDFLRRQLKEERFHVVLVGEGPEQARLEALRAELGLEGHVTMAGLQHDVRPYYTVANIVVMPSHSEGSPNVLLEAMAAGVPVVATRVGGVPEIAADGETALLVESRNPEAMARALLTVLRDSELQAKLARNGLQLAREEYSPEAYRRSLTNIYQMVLASARGR
jgi:glycosyltransferase involved in cell wall biosynthesis